jgi:hypothetical protein
VSDESLDDLAAAGWRRMSTIDEPRLSELVELYRETGFEVLLRPVSRAELGDACAECVLAQPDRFRTIYVRPAVPHGGD